MISRVNPIADVTDFSALQDDLTDMVLNHDPLIKINATQERKYLLDSAMDISALWLTPRNGASGTGIVVEDIRPAVGSKSDGSVLDLICSFVILAERNMAMTPNVGCLMQPEQVEVILFALFNRKVLQPYGQLRVEGQFAGPASDWIDDSAGIYARRITFKLLNAPVQIVTCDPVTIASDDSFAVTITCGSTADELEIYYTTDGSFPGSDPKLYPNSTLYTDVFTAESGTIVRAIAYAPGFNMSALIQKVIP